MSQITNEVGTQSDVVLTLEEPQHRNKIEFDLKKYNQMKTAYNQALADGHDAFVFEGHDFLTAYAKYMLEYIHGRLVQD